MLLKKAALAIQKRRYDKAIIRLHHALRVPQFKQTAFYWLSMLYRYLDRYDEENNIVDKALAHFPGWDYMIQRQNWHNLPLFDRLVPRPPLHLERDPQFVPKQETLEQLCFVTAGGSDQPYWNLLIELLESIKATRFYKDIPICILDVGLTDEHKHFLYHHFKVHKIKDPGWDIQAPFYTDNLWKGGNIEKKEFSSIKPGYKFIMATPFLDKHFPEFNYYIRIETDAWIQDERALDKLVCLLENQDLVGFDTGYNFANFSKVFEIPLDLTDPVIKEFNRKTSFLTVSLLGLKKSSLFQEWKKLFKNTVEQYGYIPFQEILTLTYLYKNNGLQALKDSELYDIGRGMPLFSDNYIKNPGSKEIYGVIELNSLEKEVLYKVPMIDEKILVPTDLEPSRQVFLNFIYRGKINEDYSFYQSLRYRTWPWADKEQIIQILNQETL